MDLKPHQSGRQRKVLVTGASGFVGRAVCRDLLIRGHHVRGLLRHESTAPEGIEVVRVRDLSDCLTRRDDFIRSLDGIDSLIHLAAVVHQSGNHDDGQYQAINADVTGTLAKIAVLAGVKRFIFVSSIKAMGETTAEHPFSPDGNPAPVGPYGLSKLNGETQLRKSLRGSQSNWTIVRPPLVYGAQARANLASLIRLLRSGLPLPFASISNARSMVALDNLAGLLVDCVDDEAFSSRILHPADACWSTPELIQALSKAMKQPPRLFRCPPTVLMRIAQWIGKAEAARRLTDSLEVQDTWLNQVRRWQPPQNQQEALKQMIVNDVVKR